MMKIKVYPLPSEYKAVFWVNALNNKLDGVCEWERSCES